MSTPTIELRVHERVRDIPEAEWNALLGNDGAPFLSWAWLDALERHRCVTPERGWLPMHLSLWQKGTLLGVAPAYVKGHSEGEFVFDWSWAGLAQRIGIEYYPKLILAVPFTPATGPRLLGGTEASRPRLLAALAEGVEKVTEANALSSAHVLFPTETEALSWEAQGFATRYGVQFQWHNRGYVTFDDFLKQFSSKRRHQIRRERREVEKQGITIRTLRGDDLSEEAIEAMYGFYLATVDKFTWGRRYLNRAFFFDICDRMRDHVEIVLARDGQGRALAGALNVHGGGVLYGRYWGCTEERPFLHFAVCYYHSIEDCIVRKMTRFEPGAGGEHKRARGFDPTLTYSAHHLRDLRLDGAIRAHLEKERDAVRRHVEDARGDGDKDP